MIATFILFSIYCFLFDRGAQGRIFENIVDEVVREKYTTFIPEVLTKTCLLKPQIGPCRGMINMYYFDPKEKKCSKFKWGGCQGNGNRFETELECIDTCLSKPGTKKQRPRYCFLSFDYGFCFGAVNRWYYDASWKVCKQTIYSGCGGNKNNFYSIEQCDSVCRFGLGPFTPKTRGTAGSREILIVNPTTALDKNARRGSTSVTKMMMAAESTDNNHKPNPSHVANRTS